MCALDSNDLGQGPAANSYEHGNEPSGFIKGWEFIDQKSNYHLMKDCFTESLFSRPTTFWKILLLLSSQMMAYKYETFSIDYNRHIAPEARTPLGKNPYFRVLISRTRFQIRAVTAQSV
jgi:hypothetical protein